jgi:hypothetical protein
LLPLVSRRSGTATLLITKGKQLIYRVQEFSDNGWIWDLLDMERFGRS